MQLKILYESYNYYQFDDPRPNMGGNQWSEHIKAFEKGLETPEEIMRQVGYISVAPIIKRLKAVFGSDFQRIYYRNTLAYHNRAHRDTFVPPRGAGRIGYGGHLPRVIPLSMM